MSSPLCAAAWRCPRRTVLKETTGQIQITHYPACLWALHNIPKKYLRKVGNMTSGLHRLLCCHTEADLVKRLKRDGCIDGCKKKKTLAESFSGNCFSAEQKSWTKRIHLLLIAFQRTQFKCQSFGTVNFLIVASWHTASTQPCTTQHFVYQVNF